MDIAKLLNGDQVSASIPPKETRPVREVKCPKCNKSVLSTNLNRHVKTQHQTPHDARPFTCEKTHCKRKFHFKSAGSVTRVSAKSQTSQSISLLESTALNRSGEENHLRRVAFKRIMILWYNLFTFVLYTR